MIIKTQTYILLALIVVAFIVGLCSKGDNNFDKEIEVARRETAFKNRIAEINRAKENIAKVGNAYRDTLEQVRSQFANREIEQDKKVTIAREKVTKLKAVPMPQVCDSLILAMDTVISLQGEQIVILKEEKTATWNSFNKIIETEHEEKAILQSEVDEYKEQLLLSQADVNYFKKKERRERRKRNAVIVVGLLLLGVAVTN
jgi:iron only hydrogenase large subunit-like protein